MATNGDVNGFENIISIVQDKMPIDTIEIDGKIIEL